MKNILCFGDSNTYGYKPDNSGRYGITVRWPGKLQALLGDEYHIIEEGLPGRTTVFDDPNQPYRKGEDYIVPCLLSRISLEFVIVMLGTNDCKSVFKKTSKEIALGLSEIINKIKAVTSGSAKILIISPIHLGDNIGKPGYDPDFDDVSRLTSKELALEYRKLAEETVCAFLDASEYTRASPLDEEHLDETGHYKLAGAIADMIINTAD